jgi:signal peptidase I
MDTTPAPADAPGRDDPAHDIPGHDIPAHDIPGHDEAGDGRRDGRLWWRELPALVGAALVLTMLVRAFGVQAFYIPSGSMEPSLQIGDRVLVSRVSYAVGDIKRGDVIVFNGTDSFSVGASPAPVGGGLGRASRAVGSFLGVSASEEDFTKRVIGVAGDRVACCDAAGRVTVEGRAIDEPYLMPGDAPSAVEFNVVVPDGRLWVMGDHRSDSADSRSHLGQPGGGMVPTKRVVGKVVLRFWPFSRIGAVRGSAGSQSSARGRS